MMTVKTSKSYDRACGYCEAVVGGKLEAPKYVKLQCEDFLKVCSGESEKYMIDMRRRPRYRPAYKADDNAERACRRQKRI